MGGDHDDELDGGDGNDTIAAGKGDDRMVGRSGNDDLSGGKGDDTLRGNGGQDTLNGGLNSDEMTGGTQADTFVLTADSATDTITDFENGIDVIDLDVDFATLIFADIAPGEVHITHSGETLIVMDDGLGLLTSSDFDASDFI